MTNPTPSTSDQSLSREEFVSRFTAELVRLAGSTYRDADGDEECSTAELAAEIAPSYYDEPEQRAEGPEECARLNYSYWEAE